MEMSREQKRKSFTVSCASLLKEESSRKGDRKKSVHVASFRVFVGAACACGQKSS
jgi:hypothetical protein